MSSLVKDASPVPLIDVTNLPTPRKFLDAAQYSTAGGSSAREISLQDIKEDSDLIPRRTAPSSWASLSRGWPS